MIHHQYIALDTSHTSRTRQQYSSIYTCKRGCVSKGGSAISSWGSVDLPSLVRTAVKHVRLSRGATPIILLYYHCLYGCSEFQNTAIRHVSRGAFIYFLVSLGENSNFTRQ